MVNPTYLILALILSLFIFLITWIVCVRLDKGSWVDVIWAYSIGGLSTIYFMSKNEKGLSIIPYLFIMLWSLRLGTHLLKRVLKQPEDGRYIELHKKWGGIKSRKMAAFFLLQAMAAFIFSFPAYLIIQNIEQTSVIFITIGSIIALLGISGETVADRQLSTFVKNTPNKTSVCKVGLWKYSRHPNYFFEWVFWTSFPVMFISTPTFWLLAIQPLVVYFLITKLSGIPPTEAQALRKRGAAYKAYMNETNTFIPWFPKTTQHSKPIIS